MDNLNKSKEPVIDFKNVKSNNRTPQGSKELNEGSNYLKLDIELMLFIGGGDSVRQDSSLLSLTKKFLELQMRKPGVSI